MKLKTKIIKLMDYLMLDCKEASFLISKNLDTNISLKEKIQLKSHLLYCDFCNRYHVQSKMIDDILKITPEKMNEKKLKDLHLDKEVKAKLKQRLKSKKN